MTAPVVAVSAVLLVLGLVTAWYVLRRQQEAVKVLSLNVASIRAAEELEIGMREIRTRINQFLLTGDRAHLSAVPELRKITDHWLAETRRLATTQHEQQLIQSVGRGYEHFFQKYDGLPQSPTEKTRQELQGLVEDVLTREILKPAHEYLNFNEQIIQDSLQRGQVLANRMALGLLLLSTCGPVAGLMAGFAIARNVHQTLIQLTVPVRDAAGKLNEVVGPITVSASSDFEELEVMLRGLADKVSKVVEQLQQSQQVVLRTEQLAAMGQLAAGVAHELRNPLQSIQLLVQSAAEDGEGCLEGHDLMVLRDAVSRVKRSVQTFLDFARPPTLEKRWLRLDDIVRQTIDLVAARANRQGVELLASLPNSLEVEADADQMRQLVLNLVLNALDAVSGPGKVWVVLREQSPVNESDSNQAAASIELEVCDSGPGLPADLGERIFEPFITSKETGIGLGLPICRRIVHDHGGTIRAMNGTNGGACFRVQLPAAERSPVPCGI
jgi:signal transduction histidine kinase